MDLSEFAFRITLIFVPGLIAFTIIDKLTVHKENKTLDVLLGSLTLGFICYFLYYPINLVLKIVPLLSNYINPFSFIASLSDSKSALNFQEILIVTILSIPIGLAFAAFSNHRVLYRVANQLKISKKQDDISVWNNTFCRDSPQWVIVRDTKNNIMYQGWAEFFSEGSTQYELLLRDVKVYKNSDQTELYTMSAVYFLIKDNSLILEFPSMK